jgi:hypothetical protein
MSIKILDPPDPIVKLLWLKCPDCGKRIHNAHGAERLFYLDHWFTKHNDGKMFTEDLEFDVGPWGIPWAFTLFQAIREGHLKREKSWHIHRNTHESRKSAVTPRPRKF